MAIKYKEFTAEQLNGHQLSKRDGYDEWRCVGCKAVFGGQLLHLLGATIHKLEPHCKDVQRAKALNAENRLKDAVNAANS